MVEEISRSSSMTRIVLRGSGMMVASDAREGIEAGSFVGTSS
jgi:hypothetical protein